MRRSGITCSRAQRSCWMSSTFFRIPGRKNLKRATLIGETTGGGAHPIEVHFIDDHFSIIVPVGRSISPITHTDWEGTGVEPDIKVPAADALAEALKRARDLIEKRPPGNTVRHASRPLS